MAASLALLAAAESARTQWILEAAAEALQAATHPVGITLQSYRGTMVVPLSAVATVAQLYQAAVTAAGVRRGKVHHFGPGPAHRPGIFCTVNLQAVHPATTDMPLRLFPGRRSICVECQETGKHVHVVVEVLAEMDASVRFAVQVLRTMKASSAALF